MNPSETSDGLEYKLDAFQRGFAFWDSPKAQYLPPIDDAGRREWLKGFCQARARPRRQNTPKLGPPGR